MRWLSVDPGRHGCGCAEWQGETLQKAWFASLHKTYTDLDGPARWCALAAEACGPGDLGAVVVETMRVYVGGRADPADLLDLQGVAAAVASVGWTRGAQPIGVPASQWKRQVPRAVLGARVEARVAAAGWSDRVIAPSRATYRNDIHHAIGLGWYALEAGLVGR